MCVFVYFIIIIILSIKSFSVIINQKFVDIYLFGHISCRLCAHLVYLMSTGIRSMCEWWWRWRLFMHTHTQFGRWYIYEMCVYMKCALKRKCAEASRSLANQHELLIIWILLNECAMRQTKLNEFSSYFMMNWTLNVQRIKIQFNSANDIVWIRCFVKRTDRMRNNFYYLNSLIIQSKNVH